MTHYSKEMCYFKLKFQHSKKGVSLEKSIDKVLFENGECFIFGRRSTGYFDLRLLDRTKIHASASYKKLKLLEKSKTILTEVKGDFYIPLKGSGFHA